MKRLFILSALLLLTGCAAKQRQRQKMVIPVECIYRVEGYQTQCTEISEDVAVCKNVIINFKCVKIVAQP